MTRTRLVKFGMFYMLLGAFFFSLMNSSLKILADSITINENMFFRGITMTIFIVILVYIKRKHSKTNKHHNKKGGWGKLFFRAFIGTCSLYALLYNISTIPLGTSVAFAQSTPIYTAIFAWLFLREKITLMMILSVVIGFIGVLLISNPETSNLAFINIACGILSGVFASLAFISIRALRGYFDDLIIMLSFGLMATFMGFIAVLIFQDGFSPLDLKDWICIVLVGITGTIGQYYITRAYTFAPAGIVAPIDYTRIVFSLLFGIVLGDTIPDIFSVTGMIFITISGILIAMPIILQEIRKFTIKPKG
ncbi:hypothetical protein CCY99_08845 [Helicobacter sp. 16-1353]|uniref:DMT family transporter n=1 Tax=Helicobacter sp. 16-1353 TaxID=2004996 RepID=UPI000DCE76C3|nr:DMT family transporter [Helicobacter sp. 16-1353]RAX51559.1 hypothetical protein CCY99_08845 [Helicobacter sp. 16-1353]